MNKTRRTTVTMAGLFPKPLLANEVYFQTDCLSIDHVPDTIDDLPISREAVGVGGSSKFYNYESSYFFSSIILEECDEVLIVVPNDLAGLLNLCLSLANIERHGKAAKDQVKFSVVSRIDSPPMIDFEYPFDGRFSYLWSVFSKRSTSNFVGEMSSLAMGLFDIDRLAATIAFKLPVLHGGKFLCSPLDQCLLQGARTDSRFEKVFFRIMDYVGLDASSLEGKGRMSQLQEVAKQGQGGFSAELESLYFPPLYFGNADLYERPTKNGYIVISPDYEVLVKDDSSSRNLASLRRDWLEFLPAWP